MSTPNRLNPAVLAAREKIQQGRARLQTRHDSGNLGTQVALQLAQLIDEVVLDLYQWVLEELWTAEGKSLVGRIALVAHGGYGRNDVAPYSDVDLMLLHQVKTEEEIAPLVKKFTHAVFDAGMQLGFSVRTVRQACELAKTDAPAFTTLAESRLLMGDEALFNRFTQQFRREFGRGSRGLIDAVDAARSEERTKFGETVYLLEPNIKRSRGGLRDIQFIRWIGFAQYGESEPETLHRLGALSQSDWRRIRDAREFLLRLRNELHFHAGKAHDVLERHEQVRIAKLWGYQDKPGLLAVEQFMRDYFRHTEGVSEIATHFLENARPRSAMRAIFEPLFSHQVERDFRVGPTSIRATARGLEKVRGDVAEVLRFMVLANLYDKPIDHETWEAIRSATDGAYDPQAPLPLSVETRRRFLALLESPSQLGELLRRLHRLHVLERIIPGVSHARCLLQFNNYHKFTVDEHSLRAVEAVTGFLHDPGPLGEAYRAIRNKRIVHLATLLHDLGKGYAEDHSEVGRRIALETADRLEMEPGEKETVAFLVHKHLRMSHVAQQHDIHDDRVVVDFAREVGSPETLRMLFVLTCADLAAVGPAVLNDWKLTLLTDLYLHSLDLLSSGSPEEVSDQRMRKRRQAIAVAAGIRNDQPWWRRQIEALPDGILTAVEPAQILEELAKLHDMPEREVVAWGRYLPQRRAVEYVVGAHEEITPGIFHKLTGVLSSNGQQILSAEIHTLADSLVLDRFYVEDRDFSGPPSDGRIAEICDRLVASLRDETGKPPNFRRLWQMQDASAGAIRHMPPQVRIDNHASDRYTILAVFTYDRMGLLYSITRTLFELGLSVARAKIGTHLDQVVDVFYVVQTANGAKLSDPAKCEACRSAVLAAVTPE